MNCISDVMVSVLPSVR